MHPVTPVAGIATAGIAAFRVAVKIDDCSASPQSPVKCFLIAGAAPMMAFINEGVAMSMDGAAPAGKVARRGRTAPVVIIGFDAMDCDTALSFAGDGTMPALASLLARSSRCPLTLSPGLFVNAVWADFATGLRPDRHHFLCWDEIEIATYRRRMTSPANLRGTPFWRRLAAAGYATASIDVPHTVVQDCDGDPARALEIAEWACHDRHLGLQVRPGIEREVLLATFGPHPVFGMAAEKGQNFAPDDYLHRHGTLRTPEETKQLVETLLAIMPLKTRMLRHYLAKQDWGLFIGIYGESHAAGHQLWHLHDPDHPLFDAEMQRFIGGDPLRRIYAQLDIELGQMLGAIDERAMLLVIMSHGFGGHYGGNHLLEEVLGRIDLADRRTCGEAGWSEQALRRLSTMGDSAARSALRLLRPVAQREFASPAERARQRFFLAPNNTVYGGVRLNLIGREPQGRVSLEKVDAIVDSLSRDLLALVNTKTGRPAIRAVERAERWYRRDRADAMPDLLIEWNDEVLIESVSSPKTGLVEVPYDNWRSGDHRDRGLMLASGPGVAAGASLPAMAMEDIAASVLARFGEDAGDLDGKPAAWLAQAMAMA